MNLRTVLALFIFPFTVLIGLSAQAGTHLRPPPPGWPDNLPEISYKKTAAPVMIKTISPGPVTIKGEDFYFICPANCPAEYDGSKGIRYQSMDGQFLAGSSGFIEAGIKNQRSDAHKGVVWFSGYSRITQERFQCSVKEGSKLYATATMAATAFSNGSRLTVMKRVEENECFYVQLSRRSGYDVRR